MRMWVPVGFNSCYHRLAVASPCCGQKAAALSAGRALPAGKAADEGPQFKHYSRVWQSKLGLPCGVQRWPQEPNWRLCPWPMHGRATKGPSEGLLSWGPPPAFSPFSATARAAIATRRAIARGFILMECRIKPERLIKA